MPSVDSAEAVNAIDNFVVARREQAGLTASQPAKPHILARRMYIDLIGVLPSPEQVQAFVAAADEDRQRAVVALVDQLLQSPMYGQRWARHWLDVARYSDGAEVFSTTKAWTTRGDIAIGWWTL